MQRSRKALLAVAASTVVSSASLLLLVAAYAGLMRCVVRWDVEQDWWFIAGLGYVLPILGAIGLASPGLLLIDKEIRLRFMILSLLLIFPASHAITVFIAVVMFGSMSTSTAGWLALMVGIAASLLGASALGTVRCVTRAQLEPEEPDLRAEQPDPGSD